MILIKDTEPTADMAKVRISASRGRGGANHDVLARPMPRRQRPARPRLFVRQPRRGGGQLSWSSWRTAIPPSYRTWIVASHKHHHISTKRQSGMDRKRYLVGVHPFSHALECEGKIWGANQPCPAEYGLQMSSLCIDRI